MNTRVCDYTQDARDGFENIPEGIFVRDLRLAPLFTSRWILISCSFSLTRSFTGLLCVPTGVFSVFYSSSFIFFDPAETLYSLFPRLCRRGGGESTPAGEFSRELLDLPMNFAVASTSISKWSENAWNRKNYLCDIL